MLVERQPNAAERTTPQKAIVPATGKQVSCTVHFFYGQFVTVAVALETVTDEVNVGKNGTELNATKLGTKTVHFQKI